MTRMHSDISVSEQILAIQKAKSCGTGRGTGKKRSGSLIRIPCVSYQTRDPEVEPDREHTKCVSRTRQR